MLVKITDNTPIIIANTTRSSNLALRFILDDIDRVANPVTPRKRGNLRGDILKTVLGLRGTIIWGKNYAIYQEENQFRNYTTPGTGPHYAENSVKQVADNVNKHFKKARLI